jgi:hypothetical protein
MEDFMKKKMFLVCSILGFMAFISCSFDFERSSAYFDNENALKNHHDDSIQIKSIQNSYGDVYSQSVEKFYGIKTIRTITKNGTLSFNISLSIKSGRFKIVLANENDLYLVCDNDIDGTIDLSHIKDGKYKLRLVGDNAVFDLKINF